MLNTPDLNTSASAPGIQTSERRCENPECNVSKLISMVPKRKTTQFVADPVVMEKPMLVNGFTAVFQIDGSSARLMDIKNPNGDPQVKPIYRIIPNSHVHVVNYVVVDTDETYLRKINENDPVTMQKLLTSQKESADQMLKKIMSGQGSSATAAMTTVVSTINNSTSNNNITPAFVPPTSSTNVTQTPPNTNIINPTIPAVGPQQKNTIKLPVRMHPNLKITAVTSGEPSSNLNTNINTTNTNPAPFIQTVPLTNLQASTGITMPLNNPTQNLTLPSVNTLETVDKPTYDKMQAEINDLRRTVAMLAEAQAKNQQQPQSSKVVKRPRISLPKCV